MLDKGVVVMQQYWLIFNVLSSSCRPNIIISLGQKFFGRPFLGTKFRQDIFRVDKKYLYLRVLKKAF